jgi:hypothetical protein
MGDALITILTDSSARSAAAAESTVIQHTEVAGPWFD